MGPGQGGNRLDWLTELRREFHRYPELGFEEHRTKARVAEVLRSFDIEVEEGIGVVGTLRAGTSDRCVALRADMDALPIQEQSAHDYVSRFDGVMHACGHDGHMAMLLGAANILAKHSEFEGTVKLIFQPAEEHGRGAKAMLDDQLLSRHPFDEIYGIHNLPGAPLGFVRTRTGLICSSESLFEIEIIGQGGHASMPQTGRDALTIGSELVGALQTVISRKLAPGSGAVLSVTEFVTDGQRNVLPGRVVLKGDVRARSAEDRAEIERVMRTMADGLARAHEVEAIVSFATEFIETVNAETPVQTIAAAAKAEGLALDAACQPMSFSEDFAHFSAKRPGGYLLLGNGLDGVHSRPLHASDYDFNDALLPIGARLWATLAKHALNRAAHTQN